MMSIGEREGLGTAGSALGELGVLFLRSSAVAGWLAQRWDRSSFAYCGPRQTSGPGEEKGRPERGVDR